MGEEPPRNNPWLYLSQQKNVVGTQSCVPERLGSWLPDPQRCGKAASEKCHKQGEEEEGALSAPVNEAKNGKRVWCRSGTQPAFSKWGRLKFPTSSQGKTTFKTTWPPHPPHPLHAVFHPLKTGKDRILPASPR